MLHMESELIGRATAALARVLVEMDLSSISRVWQLGSDRRYGIVLMSLNSHLKHGSR
jgi:hypothetical protein